MFRTLRKIKMRAQKKKEENIARIYIRMQSESRKLERNTQQVKMPFGRLGQAARAKRKKKGKWVLNFLDVLVDFDEFFGSAALGLPTYSIPIMDLCLWWFTRGFFFIFFEKLNWIRFWSTANKKNWERRGEITELLIWPKSILWHYFLDKKKPFRNVWHEI